MAKEHEFKVNDEVLTKQSLRPSRIVSVRTEYVQQWTNSGVKTLYKVDVPFPSLTETGWKYYSAEFEKSELKLHKAAS